MRRLSVLSVGPMESTSLVRDALLFRPGSRLSVAMSYWDLCSLSLQNQHEFEVAVLNLPSSSRELQRRAAYVRRRWPDAAILLVADNPMCLEDPLYDERVPSKIEPGALLMVIDRLTDMKHGASRTRSRQDSKANGQHHYA
jgi:hypothetical protein